LLKEHLLQCGVSVPEKTSCNCRFCDALFASHKDVLEHITNSHPIKIDETKCNHCDLKFKDASKLVEHEHNHKNPNSIECPKCGRIFKQHSNLRSKFDLWKILHFHNNSLLLF
jgi:uncharacterized C2H2 Zn-finger protein